LIVIFLCNVTTVCMIVVWVNSWRINRMQKTGWCNGLMKGVMVKGVMACRWWRMVEMQIKFETLVMKSDILLRNGVILHYRLREPFWNFLHRSRRQMRRWARDMLHKFLNFTNTTRGHPHSDQKRRRTRKKWVLYTSFIVWGASRSTRVGEEGKPKDEPSV